ncbi:MAG: VOC family protein [Bacteroidota bacterium]
MKLGYVIIYVEDVAETLAFYTTAFSLKTRFVHEGGDYAELDTGSTALAFAAKQLGESNFPDGYTPLNSTLKPAGIEIALVTEDVATAFVAALAAGATQIAPPVQKPWGQTVGYVQAPDGVLIELCTPVGGS